MVGYLYPPLFLFQRLFLYCDDRDRAALLGSDGPLFGFFGHRALVDSGNAVLRHAENFWAEFHAKAAGDTALPVDMSEHTITSFGYSVSLRCSATCISSPRVEISTLDWRMNICTWLGRELK